MDDAEIGIGKTGGRRVYFVEGFPVLGSFGNVTDERESKWGEWKVRVAGLRR